MEEVDQILVNHIGFSSEDLRDSRWRSAYDAGDLPAEATNAPDRDFPDFKTWPFFSFFLSTKCARHISSK